VLVVVVVWMCMWNWSVVCCCLFGLCFGFGSRWLVNGCRWGFVSVFSLSLRLLVMMFVVMCLVVLCL